MCESNLEILFFEQSYPFFTLSTMVTTWRLRDAVIAFEKQIERGSL
jgi:hypothetical protein